MTEFLKTKNPAFLQGFGEFRNSSVIPARQRNSMLAKDRKMSSTIVENLVGLDPRGFAPRKPSLTSGVSNCSGPSNANCKMLDLKVKIGELNEKAPLPTQEIKTLYQAGADKIKKM